MLLAFSRVHRIDLASLAHGSMIKFMIANWAKMNFQAQFRCAKATCPIATPTPNGLTILKAITRAPVFLLMWAMVSAVPCLHQLVEWSLGDPRELLRAVSLIFND